MSHPRRGIRRGFTLIELLVVIVIIGVLIALLVPAIAGAVRTARDAAVTSEINTLGQALESFRTKFGEYPPSRVILREDGIYDTNSTTALTGVTWYGGENGLKTSDNAAGNPFFSANDMNYGQLASRSLRSLRKFFPRVNYSTSTITGVSPMGTGRFDFNGDGATATGPILLQGHECLVFFLGGIPVVGTDGPTGVSGFSKNPTNPFVPVVNTNAGSNRTTSMFEFVGGRLVDNDKDGMPGYADSLNAGVNGRYYAYFYSYTSGGYDPNDVNFSPVTGEIDTEDQVSRLFGVNYTSGTVNSRAPNPYTSGPATPPGAGATSYHRGDTFQVISPGRDGIYGFGGQYTTVGSGNRLPLPDPANVNVSPSTDPPRRAAESDNLTNFATGKLE